MAVEGTRLFTEGDDLYVAMLTSIRSARNSVRMESYIFSDDEIGWQFTQALAERAAAGLDVRLHLDAAGALGGSSQVMERYLRERGGFLKWFNRWNWRHPLRYNRRNHRKLLIVDDQVAFVGGFNIHRQSSRRFYGEARWRDSHAAITGELVDDATRLFDTFWHGHRHWMPAQRGRLTPTLVSNNTRSCRHRIHCLYSDAFAGARERIFLTTPYFVPDFLTQRRLIQAARRGIDVRLLVPSKSDVPITRWAAQAYYDVLMTAGMRIYEYQPRMLHAKTAVIDSDWAAVGTANLDYRSFFLNYELVLASGERGFCSQLEQHFLNDLTESLPITSVNWERRRWSGRMLEAFGWIMRRWL
ncbi:putative cardiolipin synthase YwiE [Granulosicoccus antarcticus IMCC3135]|uniref:Putative cardiolipin synthase YwiE n=2 Tax=Granulosicoccus TaxID=437504 RepID=A0A2Z2NSZ5_9GAMM|nr:putative cardiolipin synthase YwiE [Granulosicoccus antarcticus IMCC3135]